MRAHHFRVHAPIILVLRARPEATHRESRYDDHGPQHQRPLPITHVVNVAEQIVPKTMPKVGHGRSSLVRVPPVPAPTLNLRSRISTWRQQSRHLYRGGVSLSRSSTGVRHLAKGTGSVCRGAARRVLCTNGACPLYRQETLSDPAPEHVRPPPCKTASSQYNARFPAEKVGKTGLPARRSWVGIILVWGRSSIG